MTSTLCLSRIGPATISGPENLSDWSVRNRWLRTLKNAFEADRKSRRAVHA